MAWNVNFAKLYNGLCTPAKLYLIMNAVFIFLNLLQNLGSNNYCIGVYECRYHQSKFTIFLLQFIYVLFWAWLLNWICRKGYTSISWVLVLLPFIFLFILLAMLIVIGGFKEIEFLKMSI